MKRIFLIFLLSLLLVPSLVNASFVHEIEIKNRDAHVSSFLTLDSPQGDQKWQTEVSIDMPNNTEVLRVEDGENNLSFDFEDDLIFKTDPSRDDKERVKIVYSINDVKEERFPQLYATEINLPGFKNEKSKAKVTANNLISRYTPLKFKSQEINNSLLFEGSGPLSLKLYTSKGGKKTENYRYFGRADLNRTEELFPLLPFLTGIESPHDKYALVLLDEKNYEREINEWSSGVYRTGGLIIVRSNLSQADLTSSILHETMHGFNEEVMKWDETETVYYDEGMAKFVEYLSLEKLNKTQAEIFGDRVYLEKNNRRYYIEPRSSFEELWNYYDSQKNFLRYWNPYKEESSRDRRFGYALSELLIRKRVKDQGIENLREISKKLAERSVPVKRINEKAAILSNLFGGLKPCYSENRSKFEGCISEINEQDIDLKELDLDVKPTSPKPSKKLNVTEKDFELPKTRKTIQERMLNKFKSLLSGLIGWISETLLKMS